MLPAALTSRANEGTCAMIIVLRNIPQRVLALILTSLLASSAPAALAALQKLPAPTVTLFEFSGSANEPAWISVNDGVMGGVSRGGAKLIDGSLHFRGVLSLENNGGFSSIRSGGPTRDLSAAKAIVLRVKGDGRTYRLQLGTNAEFRRSRISYQTEFPTKRGEWTDVTVPLATLVPQFRGQKLSGPPLDRARIEEIGLSLSDGNPGAFALEVDWIRAE
jgi:monofunctional biosynthetic peptidoglycan transglycosylase